MVAGVKKIRQQRQSQTPPVTADVDLPQGKSAGLDTAAPVAVLPEKRKLPPLPVGEITQAQGEAYCKLICDTYPEVFDGKKGHFIGAEATMYVKEGHMQKLRQVGVRPPAKIPYGLEEQ